MPVPVALARLLAGRPVPGRPEQAFPFLTVDAAGFPHVALLSRAELDVSRDGGAVLAVLASRRSRANLRRTGQATLVAVGGTTAHYAKLRLAHAIEQHDRLACRLELADYQADTLGIELSAICYEASGALAELERWDISDRLMQSLDPDGSSPG
jgi:hypothetical protein